MTVSKPDDETQRLESLRRLELLDTGREPEFDELAELAAAVCATPISLLILVDEHRLWFKAAVGLDVCEMARDGAFCAYTIRQQGVFVVEDAAVDKRFASNPMVTGEPHIRFYAGAPIAGPGGHAVGTLCAIDRKPRTLTAFQMKMLALLARQVNARLELRLERKQSQAALLEVRSQNDLRLSQAQAELQSANALLKELVVTDALTGLGNRRVLEERLAAEMTAARRGRPLALLMLDIDHFKKRNDTFGHLDGDEVLRQMGTLLGRLVRGNEIGVRYGGDEMAVLMPNASEDDAAGLARRLLKAVRTAEWARQPVTISIGVASCSNGDMTAPGLVAAADLAMYAAKAAGRDRFVRRSETL
ncbi:MAG: sensor domain-containing diguanylate cyclase [Acidobacteriota bacterium]|nr:sensor domain-containing diguanylate cyclase [Acidobacteriota bacterium]